MARKLVCDRCGSDELENEQSRQAFMTLTLNKVGTTSAPAKVYDLCKDCVREVRHWIATLQAGPRDE